MSIVKNILSEIMKRIHERDISHDYEIVNLPDAVRRKFPNAKKEFKWQYVFRQ